MCQEHTHISYDEVLKFLNVSFEKRDKKKQWVRTKDTFGLSVGHLVLVVPKIPETRFNHKGNTKWTQYNGYPSTCVRFAIFVDMHFPF